MKQRNEPTLEDIIKNSEEDVKYSLNCHRVGVIEAFYPETQTADIKMVDKGVQQFEDGEKLIDLPPLINCPVIISKGINGGLTFPINSGDTCLIIFNDRDLDNWLIDGLTQRPNTLRSHDFSDAIALVGLRNQINQITDYNNEETKLNYLDNKITINITSIKLDNVNGGSIAVTNKLELKNGAENLKAIIDDFIDIVKNLKAVDPISGLLPIDPAATIALTALSARVNTLLL